MAIRTPVLLSWLIVVAAPASLAVAAGPADPAAPLDMLSHATDDAAPGLTLAHRQIAAGDLLGALATLERVMIVHPEVQQALLEHASLLCRLDDRDGAKVEFDELDRRAFVAGNWASATAPCGGSPSDYGWGG
jgi:hypothetical protein